MMMMEAHILKAINCCQDIPPTMMGVVLVHMCRFNLSPPRINVTKDNNKRKSHFPFFFTCSFLCVNVLPTAKKIHPTKLNTKNG